MYNKNSISLIQLSNYVKPDVVENMVDKWVLNGKDNEFFQYIIDRYNGSATNRIIIDTYQKLYYGQGIAENGKSEVYEDLSEIFNKREQKKCLSDLKQFGQYDMQIIRAKGGGGVAEIKHIPTNKIAPEKADENGIINNYYFSDDWSDRYRNKPKPIPAFKIVNGRPKEALSIKSVRPYSAGKFYFADPDYLAALQYAELEEEISNYFINHIQNGLSFGYIINLNNGGELDDDQKQEIENKIKRSLTGTSNAGKFIISFNDGKEAEVTIVPLEVNDAHNQWEFLVKEARQQIITSHGAFPNLFGVDAGGGFANNADELDVQSRILQDLRITPQQELFIDELAPILELNGLETDLAFIPLRDTYKSTEEVVEDNTVTDDTVDDEENEEVELNDHNHDHAPDSLADELIELGEDFSPEDWIVLSETEVDYESDDLINELIQFASTGTARPNAKSSQDSDDIVIRYKYAGNRSPQREFCKKMMGASKVYRKEDILQMSSKPVNPGFGLGGSNTYDIWLWKGGGKISTQNPNGTCRHAWHRVIYLKRGGGVDVNSPLAKRISVAEAKRKGYKVPVNDPRAGRTPNKKGAY